MAVFINTLAELLAVGAAERRRTIFFYQLILLSTTAFIFTTLHACVVAGNMKAALLPTLAKLPGEVVATGRWCAYMTFKFIF